MKTETIKTTATQGRIRILSRVVRGDPDDPVVKLTAGQQALLLEMRRPG